jgi:RNA polymerase sigma factor (sigma-70 family)
MDELAVRAELGRVCAGDAAALQRLLVCYHAALRVSVARAVAPPLRSRIDPDDVLQEAYTAAFRQFRAARVDGGQSREFRANDGAQPRAASFDNGAQFYRWLETTALNKLRDMQRALGRQKRAAIRDVSMRGAAPGGAAAREATLGGSAAREATLGSSAARGFARPADPTASYPQLVERLAASDPTPSRVLAREEAVAAVMTCLAQLTDDQRDVIRLRVLEDVPTPEIARRLGKTEPAVYATWARAIRALRDLLGPITRYLTRL